MISMSGLDSYRAHLLEPMMTTNGILVCHGLKLQESVSPPTCLSRRGTTPVQNKTLNSAAKVPQQADDDHTQGLLGKPEVWPIF